MYYPTLCRRLAIGLFCALTFCATAFAQVYEGQRLVKPQIWVSNTDFTRPFYIAVYFKIAPEWHLYWKNPGDSGMPPQMRLSLPPSFEVDNPLFPMPHSLPSDEGVNYAYTDELMVLLPITPSETTSTDTALQFTLYADWLVCREKCLRGADTLQFDSRQISPEAATDMQHRISRNLRNMPTDLSKLGTAIQSVKLQRKKQQLSAVITLSKALPTTSDIAFFPEPIPDYIISYSNITIEKRRRIVIPLSPETDNAPPPAAIKGLVILNDIAYELNTNK